MASPRDQEARAVAERERAEAASERTAPPGACGTVAAAQSDLSRRDGDAGVHELRDAGGEPAEEDQQPVAAGVDDAGLLQGRQLLGRLLDRDACRPPRPRRAACRGRACSGTLCAASAILRIDGEHGALDRLLDGAIGAAGALGERLLEVRRGEVLGAAPHIAEAAHDLREDHAGVAARAHERTLGDRGGDRRDALDVALLELFENRAHGEREVGARVAVRDRVHVEVVDDAALSLDGCERGIDNGDGGEPYAQSWRSSTRTLTSPRGTPPTWPTW